MGLKPRKKATGLKTQPTRASVVSFIGELGNERRESECKRLVSMMKRVTGKKPVMWGTSIIGFGTYHYKYASGREGDWPRTGFSPRKASLTIYCMPGFGEQKDLLAKLGKHTTSVSCLYIKKLDDVDLDVLEKIVARSYKQMSRIYP